MAIIISSQHYRNEDIVAAKLAAKDFAVCLSPEFEIDGETYQIVVDGHHSLEAAKEAGVEPEWQDANENLTREYERVLDQYGPEALLEMCWIDTQWHNALTGQFIW